MFFFFTNFLELLKTVHMKSDSMNKDTTTLTKKKHFNEKSTNGDFSVKNNSMLNDSRNKYKISF